MCRGNAWHVMEIYRLSILEGSRRVWQHARCQWLMLGQRLMAQVSVTDMSHSRRGDQPAHCSRTAIECSLCMGGCCTLKTQSIDWEFGRSRKDKDVLLPARDISAKCGTNQQNSSEELELRRPVPTQDPFRQLCIPCSRVSHLEPQPVPTSRSSYVV